MSQSPAEQLHALFQDEWAFRLRENPTFATATGETRYNDRLPTFDEANFARQAQTLRGFITRLQAIPREQLSQAEQIDADFFAREVNSQLAELEFGAGYIPLTKSYGLPVFLPDVVAITPFRSQQDYERYLQRLRAFSVAADELIVLMRAGMAKGYLPSRYALAGVVEGFRLHVSTAENAPRQNVYFQPFQSLPKTIPEDAGERLCAAAEAVIHEALGPAYRRLADFLETEYLPAAPEQGSHQMPHQAAYYTACLRRYTSLDLTPGEVHQTGLAEVARIRTEMAGVMRSVGFQGSLRAFSDALRSDPRFFVETPDQLLKEVAYLMKRIEGQLPGLFKTLPRTPFGMREIPDYLAPTSTSAYYFLPAGDGSTAGFYYVNTYDLKSRPLYEYEALSMHEAVPGHHLQLALQLELTDVPSFRKWGETTAFVEGWALYAERLGLEMGFYKDAYTNFGRLVYEMWRAARLVVDTGLHAFGWTRQQAIAYLAENTALSLLNIANEVDRYISWPGQAVAYKIGELKIRALREQAEQALGTRFDVREFHDVVLRAGGIPLVVLEQTVTAWIQSAAG